jgi:regulator of replication initiation timing
MAKLEVAELEEINKLRTQLGTTVSEAGQLSIQIELLKSDITELTTKFTKETETFKALLSEEQILIKRLSDKYGTGSIDFETGEFTPEK